MAPETGKVGMIGKAIQKFQCRGPELFDTGRPAVQTRSPKVVMSSDSCSKPQWHRKGHPSGGQDVLLFWNDYCLPEDYTESEQRGKNCVRYPEQANSLAWKQSPLLDSCHTSLNVSSNSSCSTVHRLPASNSNYHSLSFIHTVSMIHMQHIHILLGSALGVWHSPRGFLWVNSIILPASILKGLSETHCL